jgi:uncharacterized protein YwqG
MGFIAQVLLSDVPGLDGDTGKILSFHYCHQCMYDGKMSFGWDAEGDAESEEPKGYDVCVFDIAGRQADGSGLADEDVIGPHSVRFEDYDELIVYTESDLQTDQSLRTRIEAALSQGVITEIPSDQTNGFRSYDTAPAPSKSDGGADWVYWTYPEEFHDGDQTKIGGWPNWDQDESWPTLLSKDSPIFVAQIDFGLGSSTAWGGGGKAYLFVSPPKSSPRVGVFVIQNT